MQHIGDTLKGGFPPPTPTQTIITHRPICPTCLDTGFVNIGDSRRFCDCPAGQRAERVEWRQTSGVPGVRRSEILDNFQPLPGTEAALAAAREIVAGTLSWLLLYGKQGNGKTHLANGIVLASIEAGRRARVVNSLVLLSDLRAVSGSPAQSLHLRDLAAIPLLVVDDLIWATDLEARWLEEVLQRRYMEKRPLVATTNKDLRELPAPLVSRFWELGRAVLNTGQDYRRGKSARANG